MSQLAGYLLQRVLGQSGYALACVHRTWAGMAGGDGAVGASKHVQGCRMLSRMGTWHVLYYGAQDEALQLFGADAKVVLFYFH